MQELTASKYQGHHGPVLSLDVSADDTCLLSGSEDHTARLWDVRENHKRRASLCIQTHGEVLSVAFAPPVLSKETKENKDVHLASVFAQDHSVYLSVENGVYEYDLRQVNTPIVNQPTRNLSPILQNQDEVNQISLTYHIPKQPSNNNNKKRKNNSNSKFAKQQQTLFLAAADDAGTVRFMEASSTTTSQVLRHDPNAVVTACAFRPHSSRPKKGSTILELASGGTDCTIKLWDAFKPKRPISSYSISTPETESGKPQVCNPPMVYSMSWSKSGNLLAAGLGDGNVNIFSFQNRNLVQTGLLPDGHDASIASVLFPFETNDRVLYSGGSDGNILCWDLGRTVCNCDMDDSSLPTTADPSDLISPSLLQQRSMSIDGNDEEDLIRQTEALSLDKPKILFGLPHGNKINWMTSTSRSKPSTLFVTDTTNDITAYSIPLQ